MAETRLRSDACPGALTVHVAADGGLARVRLPGGLITAAALRVLATAASDLGDGELELTSRGNIQLRGLAPGAEFDLGERIAAVGLLPSPSHERVRNIVASPLAGIDRPDIPSTGQTTELAELAQELDRKLCAEPMLAELPGRFLFGLDDGRGDILALEPDLTAFASTPGRFQIWQPHADRGCEVPVEGVTDTLVAGALMFLQERKATNSKAWRISELPDSARHVTDRLIAEFGASPAAGTRGPLFAGVPAGTAEPAGIVEQPDGRSALVVLAPLGRLSGQQVHFLASKAGSRGLRITPWRSVVVPDLVDVGSVAQAAAEFGLGVDTDSPWYHISTCAGRPGCAKALADVRADAIAELERSGTPQYTVRWSGCERQCGRPRHTAVHLIATGNGYRRMENGIS
ncbi:precorrin-3B synthase [Jatrophihabitans sp. DSM 45814]